MTSTPASGPSVAGPWYRVLAITADPGRGSSAQRDYAAVLPAALNATAARRPFIAGWLSRGGGEPLQLITTAGPLPEPAAASGAGRGAAEMLFPWGARGVLVPGGLAADLDRLIWAPCPLRQAPGLGGGPGQNPGGQPASSGAEGYRSPGPGAAGAGASLASQAAQQPTLFESALVSLMTRAFGWLVAAEPTGQIGAEITDLRASLNVVMRRDEEHARHETARIQRRLAELDEFREAGLWQVRVLAGAATGPELALIAPVLAGALDLTAHPCRLRCAGDPGQLAAALAARHADPDDGAQVPFPATAGVLAALAGLPRAEVPGVRILDPGCFDVTSETSSPDGEAGPHGPGAARAAISLGTILDGQDRPVGTFSVPLATLNRHAFVTGATGAGKSQTVRHMLEKLTTAGIPWLAVEPVKAEYAAMAGRIAGAGEVTVINPSDATAVPMSVNPLQPEPGYPVQAHIDMVRALFLAAFESHEPFPQIISQALQLVYQQSGWDPVTGAGQPGAPAPPAVPTLAGLRTAALEVIEDVGYGPELRADVRGFVDVRLRSLRTGSAGRFFEGGHPADIAELLRRNVVLAIEDVANDEDKAFLMGTLIIRLVEHLRLRTRAAPPAGLHHVIVIEEAHRLLRADREGAGSHAVELFASLLAEIRAYGEGIVVVEQIPAKLVPDVVKNTALKVLHRLPARDDRDVVGAAMNLDPDQSRQVVSLQPGVAAVFADGMDRPLRISVPYGGHRERRGGPVTPPPGQAAASAWPQPPLQGRRSAACGPACRTGRACTLVELRAADLLATSPQDAWLRVWTEVLTLAFLAGRPLPGVPGVLRSRWEDLQPRLRDCLLATTVDAAVAGRAQAVRGSYDPQLLAAQIAGTALRLLDGRPGAGTLAGRQWVISQLRWLHEAERVCPYGAARPDPSDPAPALDYQVDGLAGQPGLRVAERVASLRSHPLSMELARNREPAWAVILGDDEQRGFADDLAAVIIGVSHRTQLRQAAAQMGVSGWLETVLSWPRRFIVGPGELLAVIEPPGAFGPPAAPTGAAAAGAGPAS